MSSANAATARTRLARADRGGPAADAPTAPTSEVALVAVDLLWLDDESALRRPAARAQADPRVGRRRIASSSGVGIYVRPPIDTWLGSWRSFGFSRLAYKAANSRYMPGQKNPAWAIAEIPRR